MTVKHRSELKTKFETGDKPSQQDFYDLIDSYVHVVDDPTKALPPVSAQDAGKILKTNGTNVAWSAESPFPEAPQDGKQYARQNADWSEVAPSEGNIIELDVNTTGYGSPTINYSVPTVGDLPTPETDETVVNGVWAETADAPAYKFFYYYGQWQWLSADQYGLEPYIVGTNQEDGIKLIDSTGNYNPAYVIFPGGDNAKTYNRSSYLNTLPMDFPYTIDTSRTQGVWIGGEDFTVGTRRQIIPTGYLTNDSGGWFFAQKTHLDFEFYPQGWEDSAPNAWSRWAWGIEGGVGGILFGENNAGDNNGDGWGNEASLTHLGELKRYTLSDFEYNMLTGGIYNRVDANRFNSNSTPYTMSAYDMDTLWVLEDYTGTINIPDLAGIWRFMIRNTSNEFSIIDNEGGNAILHNGTYISDFVGEDGMLLQVIRPSVNGGLRVVASDFLNWMGGTLPWGSLDFTASYAKDIGDFRNSVQISDNDIDWGLAFDWDAYGLVGRILHLDLDNDISRTMNLNTFSNGEYVYIYVHDNAELGSEIGLTLDAEGTGGNINGVGSIFVPAGNWVQLVCVTGQSTDFKIIAASDISLIGGNAVANLSDMPDNDIQNVLALTPTSTTNFVYTNGQLTSYDEVRNGITYNWYNSYDGDNRLVYATIVGGNLPMYGFSYIYDVNGNLTDITLGLD